MKTSSLKISNFLVIITCFILTLGNPLQAQEPSQTPPCNDCQLTAKDFTLFLDFLQISYKAEVDVIFGQNRTHFLEFYLNDNLIHEAGHENIGFGASKEYSKVVPSTELHQFAGNSLSVTVKEFKRKDDGTKGEIVYETTKLIHKKTPLVKKDQQDKFAFYTDELNGNSCNGEKITQVNGSINENSIKSLVSNQRESDLFLFPKGKSVEFGIWFHASSSIDEVKATVYGNAEGPMEIGVSEIVSVDNFFGFYNRIVILEHLFEALNFNAHYNYSNAIVLKFYQAGSVAYSLVIPVLVVGEDTDFSAKKSTWTPPIPSMILHNPIGEGSSASLEENTSSCSQIKMGFSDESNIKSNLTVTVGAAGSVFGVPFEASASAGVEVETKKGSSTEMVSDVCIQHNKVIKIQNPEDETQLLERTAGDRFIGAASEYKYGPSLKIEHKNCGIKIGKGIGMETISAKYFNFSEYEIENTVIPSLIDQVATTTEAETLLRLNTSLDAWRTMVQKNREYVNTNNTGVIESVRSDNHIGESREVIRTESFSMNTKVVMDSEVFAQADINVAGSGFSVGSGVAFSNEVTNGNSATTDLRTITAYELKENDKGDIVKVKVIPDKRFGSHIFKFVEEGSKTSCPFIGGKRRDVPALSIGTNKQKQATFNNIPVGESLGDRAFITLNICNDNETGEARNYYIKAKETRNAEIKYSGNEITNKGQLIYDIPSGDCKPIEITIDQQNPNTLSYENIILQLTDACSDVPGDEDVSSEVSLDVYFAEAKPEQDLQVIFQLDLSNEIIAPEGVYVAGNFQQKAGFPNDWNPTATPMTDADGDGIYEVTVKIAQAEAGQTFQHKFINGFQWEGVPENCAEQESGYGNRFFVTPEQANQLTIPVVCFQTCKACEAPVFVEEMTVLPDNNSASVVQASGGQIDFTVTANTGWRVSSNMPWANISPANGTNNGGFKVTVEAYQGAVNRVAEITVRSDGGMVEKRNLVQVVAGPTCFIDFVDLQVKDCHNNDTPNDPTDDYYEYSLNPEGEPIGLTYSVFEEGQLVKAGVRYGTETVIRKVFPHTEPGNFNITIKDDSYQDCERTVLLVAPNCPINPPVENQADYIVTSLTSSVTTVTPYQSFLMTARIKNVGKQDVTIGTIAQYWLSNDEVLSSDDIRLNDFIDNVKALAIGEEQEKREVVYIPKGTKDGLYYLIYQVDANEQISESNEDNNIQFVPITVVQPDYSVVYLSNPPSEAYNGQKIYMKAKIKNIGSQDFDYKTKAYYWLSKNESLDAEDIYLDEDNINPLKIGDINTDEESFYIPDNISGDWYIIYQADSRNQVTEYNKENNIAVTTKITIRSSSGRSSAQNNNFIAGNLETNSEVLAAKLLQNNPNPASYQTTIPFEIPEVFQKAQLQIVGIDGRIIQVRDIAEAGKQQLQIATADWAEGQYFYSLILDNRRIATKRMLVTRK